MTSYAPESLPAKLDTMRGRIREILLDTPSSRSSDKILLYKISFIQEPYLGGMHPLNLGFCYSHLKRGIPMWVQSAETRKDGEQLAYKLQYEQQLDTTEPKLVVDSIKKLLPEMSKWRVEELGAIVRKHYMARYKPNKKKTKYGNLNKGFTEAQYNIFIRAIKNPKLRLLFEYQATLGLRIGEVIKVNLKDIDLETRELKIKTEKTRVLDVLIIPVALFKETLDFIRANQAKIEGSEGYLFFVDKERSHRKHQPTPYICAGYVRNTLREIVEIAGLEECYDISDEVAGRTPRKLHRLTTHSLRHFAITRFAKQTNGNLLLTSKFARHLSPEVTTRYTHVDKHEIFDVMDSLSLGEVVQLKARVGR